MRRLVLILLLLLLPSAGVAQPWLRPSFMPGTAGLLCRPAIQAAERSHGIPAGLLAAMGRVESGRPVAGSGAQPWPWTIDVEGQGAFFDTETQAIAAVRAAQARGVRSIDIGCLQVNLMHHPHAFASLEQAFDPASNANYAASFLRDLFGQTGSWPQAAALYHSATPALGDAYRRQVLAAWPEEARQAGQTAAAPRTFAAWATPMPNNVTGPVRRVASLRIPPGWDLVMHRDPVLRPATAPGCAFAAIVSCNRVRPKALR